MYRAGVSFVGCLTVLVSFLLERKIMAPEQILQAFIYHTICKLSYIIQYVSFHISYNLQAFIYHTVCKLSYIIQLASFHISYSLQAFIYHTICKLSYIIQLASFHISYNLQAFVYHVQLPKRVCSLFYNVFFVFSEVLWLPGQPREEMCVLFSGCDNFWYSPAVRVLEAWVTMLLEEIQMSPV